MLAMCVLDALKIQPLFIPEMIVNSRYVHPGRLADFTHRRRLKPFCGKDFASTIDQFLTCIIHFKHPFQSNT
jgi:hypothetical protein